MSVIYPTVSWRLVSMAQQRRELNLLPKRPERRERALWTESVVFSAGVCMHVRLMDRREVTELPSVCGWSAGMSQCVVSWQRCLRTPTLPTRCTAGPTRALCRPVSCAGRLPGVACHA